MDMQKDPDVIKYLRPTPDDFDNYLPWACTQLSVEVMIVITKTFLPEYVGAVTSDRSKQKEKTKPKTPSVTETEEIDDKGSSMLSFMGFESKINIETVYDSNMNLVKIKFLKNKAIPRIVMKIIGLIIPFHRYLTSITIDSGLHMEAMYEISQFLPISRITEVCLDYTFLIEGNYYVLLDMNSLQHLSLAKCKINDVVVKTIAFKLAYPHPTSQKLSVLNLATNRITDVGVKYLAEALRSNRQLSYLNLSDNMITDNGAICLFDILEEFPLTMQEMRITRGKHISYLKEKIEIVLKTAKDMRANDFDKKMSRKKPLKALTSKKKIVEQELSVSGCKTRSMLNEDAAYYEKAEALVTSILGPFQDPFDASNTEIRNEIVYCHGNNALCYLNLAYNDLTIISVKKLHHVLLSQKLLNKKPRGLINVNIEGNFLPALSLELIGIDDMLESGLASYKRISSTKRRPSSRSGAK